MSPFSVPISWSFGAALLIAPTAHASRPPIEPPSATTGSVDLLLVGGGGMYGPSMGLAARFRNGFGISFRHSQWQGGQAQEAGLSFIPSAFLGTARRPYFGTEILRADASASGFGGLPTLESKRDRPALLLVAGQEHRMGGRMALAYEAAGGMRLTRAFTGPLPPLAFQARVEMRYRLF